MLLSIVVPVRNGLPFLAPCVAALAAAVRGYDCEVVVVDDGSDDGTGPWLDREVGPRAGWRVLHLPQAGGAAAARQRGLGAAAGDWIAFADADDWVDPDWLDHRRPHLDDPQVDALVGNYFEFAGDPGDAPRAPGLTRQPWGQTLSGRAWLRRQVAAREWPHYVWLQCLRRHLLDAPGAYFQASHPPHEDITFTAGWALGARGVRFLAEPDYGYRCQPRSLTRDPSPEARGRRARAYCIVIPALLRLSAEIRQEDPQTARALRRHAAVECGHLLGLLRRLRRAEAWPELRSRARQAAIVRTAWRGLTGRRSLLVAAKLTLLLGLPGPAEVISRPTRSSAL